MNTNYNDQSNWSEIKGKIRSKWSKFTDQEIEGVKGNLDLLKGKIQKAYNCPEDRAEREFDEFQASLSSVKNRPSQHQNKDGTQSWKNQEGRERGADRPDMSQDDELSASKTA